MEDQGKTLKRCVVVKEEYKRVELQLGRSVSGDMRQEVNEEEGRGREEVMVGWGGSR